MHMSSIYVCHMVGLWLLLTISCRQRLFWSVNFPGYVYDSTTRRNYEVTMDKSTHTIWNNARVNIFSLLKEDVTMIKQTCNTAHACTHTITAASTWDESLRQMMWLRFTARGHDSHCMTHLHDDVMKWKHFPRHWPFVRGIHRSRWVPRTRASDAEPWCFDWSAPEYTIE